MILQKPIKTKAGYPLCKMFIATMLHYAPAGRDKLSEIMPSKGSDRSAVKVCLLGLLALEGRPLRGRVYKILTILCGHFFLSFQ